MVARQGSSSPGRLGLLPKAIILVWAAVLIRFFEVAVLDHRYFFTIAAKQQVGQKEIIPERGSIITEENEPLATDILTYSVNVIPKNIPDKRAFADLLAPAIGMDAETLFSTINNNKLYLPPLLRGLTEEAAERLASLKLPGLFLKAEPKRFYPEGSFAAHLLGFVNAEGKGQYGLEGYYDDLLSGLRGAVSYERNARRQPIGLQELLAPARDGTSIVTSINRNLQFIVEQHLSDGVREFSADGGSVVVMDVSTGAIMAMASYPAFDPNNFFQVGSATQIFLNPVTQSTWEPGSVIKPLVMAAAINENRVAPDTTETFSNSVVVDGWTINTAQNKTFGRETMTQVLENSDNVAMVWVAEKLGKEKFYEYLVNFGFDAKTGVDLMGEAETQILPLREWRNINRATISFGQGIAITPLQLVTAYAALANGGKLMWPHVVTAFVAPNGEVRRVEPRAVRAILSKETTDKITAMLVSVVENGHGKRAKVPGYRVAGKTGTAQVPSPEGGYSKDKHVGSFCGYAPAERPFFAMCVKLDAPKNVNWAEASAAPVFGRIASWILANYNIPPDGIVP